MRRFYTLLVVVYVAIAIAAFAAGCGTGAMCALIFAVLCIILAEIETIKERIGR